MTWKKATVIGIPVIILALGAPGAALADLVMNGGFESYSTGPNGPGNLTNYTTVTNWTSPATNSYGYPPNSFLFTPGAADTTGSYYSYNGAYYTLWGPGNGANNGLPATSPAGGNFLALDGDYLYSAAVSQTINGLTAGQTYQVGFYWAGAQLAGTYGATTEQLQVSLGGETQSTTVVNNASQGFTGWMYTTLNFTADSASDALSFLAVGTPEGYPPMVLLDGVSMNAVPEPSALLLMGAGLLGLGAYRRLRRRAGSAAV